MRKLLYLLSFIFVFGAVPVFAVSFPLSVHSSGRYLIDAGGTPFRIQSDAAWFMATRSVATDVDAYLADRKAKGFNTFVLMGVVASGYAPGTQNDGNEPYNRGGDLPWQKAAGGATYDSPSSQVPDLSTPNPAYWAYVDTILNKAQAQGFAVLFFPLYLGHEGQGEGWYTTLIDAGNSQATAYQYGQWLGTRYASQGNIIWMAGGDYNPPAGSEGETRDHKMLEGIKAAGANQIWGAQWNGGDSLAMDVPAFTSVMDIDTFYGYGPSGNNGLPYQTAARGWEISPPKPTILFEPTYEGDGFGPPDTRVAMRFYQWSCILAGSTAGTSFGTKGVWDWLNSAAGEYHWVDRLNSPGSQDMAVLFPFFGTIPWYNHKPSGTSSGYLGRTLIVSGQRSGSSSINASADGNGNGTSLVAYVPSSGTGTQTFAVDLRGMGATTRGRWFNPVTGVYTAIGSYPNSILSQSFTTPGDNGTGSNDWVLVVDLLDGVPPDVTINVKPANPSGQNSGSFSFSSTNPTATFECALDAGGFASCISPFTYLSLADGIHSFSVQARDPNGIVTPNPAVYTWKIDTVTLNPTPAISGLSPAGAVSAGGAFTLTVNGSNFVAGSVVLWNGSSRTTTLVSSSKLQAAIMASDIASVGSAVVTVSSPAPGGGVSNSSVFSITAAPLTIGETAILGSNDSGNGNLLVTQQVDLGRLATLQSMSFYVTSASGRLRLGVYDATGSGGGPGQLKAQTAEFTPTAGWNTVNVVAPVSLPAGTYWLAYLPSSNSLAFKVTSSGSSKYYGYTYGALPSTFSATATTITSHWSMYATLTEISQTLAGISVSPATASIANNGTQQFTATAKDQNGIALGLQPVFTWAASGGGSINASGLFTASGTTGAYTVTATSGGVSGTASVTVAASASFTIGETGILGTSDKGKGNLLVSQQVTLGKTATIQSMSFYVAATGGKLRLGLYDATGTGGGPGQLKAQTAEFTPATGWNTKNVVSPVSLPAGTYWLAYLPSSSSMACRMASSGTSKYVGYTYGTLPTSFSKYPTTTTSHWSFYATLQ